MDSKAPGPSEDAPVGGLGVAIDMTDDNPNQTAPKRQCLVLVFVIQA